jgi:glutaminase
METTLQQALDDALVRAGELQDGKVANYIPELARVPPEHFALAACTVDGAQASAGDDAVELTLQSVSKPFVYARALDLWGVAAVHERVGVEPTGDPFDSIIRLDAAKRPHNPMVNAGALAVTSLLIEKSDADPGRRTGQLVELFSAFAGRPLPGIDASVYLSERATGHRNRAIAHLLRNFQVLAAPVEDTLELYFQQCSVRVTTRDLAVMAATLAAGGRNPLTGQQVVSRELLPPVLTLMFLCGLYDDSGSFAMEVGVPAKSGVSGAILAVVPGRLGLAAFAPRLDAHGNSVRGVAALRHLSRTLGLHTFAFGAPTADG